MSRAPTGQNDRVLHTNARGQSRIIGDPFASISNSSSSGGTAAVTPTYDSEGRRTDPINAYGYSVTAKGTTSGALLSRQQQESLQSQEAAGMLLDALEKYGPAPGARAMLDWERQAAVHAQQTGVYVTWRSSTGADCTRVGPDALCFCGHVYGNHGGPSNDGWKKNKMSCDSASCGCTNYSFIPRRPEEAGEWWLPRRKDFKVEEWKAKCKCKHSHDQHAAKHGSHPCKLCGCGAWNSAFLCVVCDRHSEDHETVWETTQERISAGKPVGEEYMPFHEAPQIQKLVFERKQNSFQPRPGEKPKKLGEAEGARPRKAIPSSSAAAGGSAARSSKEALAQVNQASADAVASIFKPKMTASSSASSSQARQRPLEDAFAAQSLHDDDYDDPDDPFAGHAAAAPTRKPATTAAASKSTAVRSSTTTRTGGAASTTTPKPAAAGPFLGAFCHNCGTANPIQTARFCSSCGTPAASR